MSLLTDAAPDVAALAAARIKRAIRASIVASVEQLDAICWSLWRNPDVDPQDVFDVFGANATKLLDDIDAWVTFITALATSNGDAIGDYVDADIYTPTDTFTRNMDGTVTVS